jgi:hypothetical protein
LLMIKPLLDSPKPFPWYIITLTFSVCCD